jgi:hypothetical protein
MKRTVLLDQDKTKILNQTSRGGHGSDAGPSFDEKSSISQLTSRPKHAHNNERARKRRLSLHSLGNNCIFAPEIH